jgi:hypothetical protein
VHAADVGRHRPVSGFAALSPNGNYRHPVLIHFRLE